MEREKCTRVAALLYIATIPYGNQGYDDVYEKLGNGYHLTCPENISKIQNWPAVQFYNDIAKKCFVLGEQDRSSFAELVEFIKSKLNDEELRTDDETTQAYLTKSNLLLDDYLRTRQSRTSDIAKRMTVPNKSST